MNPQMFDNVQGGRSRKDRIRRAAEQDQQEQMARATAQNSFPNRGHRGLGAGSDMNAAVTLANLGGDESPGPGVEKKAAVAEGQKKEDMHQQQHKGNDDGSVRKQPPPPLSEQDIQQHLKETAQDAPEIEGETQKTFPEILMEILSDPSNERSVSWLPHGKSFRIHKRDEFLEEILPKHYGKIQGGATGGGVIKYTSFTRKLSRWEFVRLSSGPDIGSFYHKLFRRDKPQLCKKMFCKGERPKFVRSAVLGVVGAPHGVGMNQLNSHPAAGTAGISQADHASLRNLRVAQRSALASPMQARGLLNLGGSFQDSNNSLAMAALGGTAQAAQQQQQQQQQNINANMNANEVGMLRDQFAVNRLLKYKLELQAAIEEKKRAVAATAAEIQRQQHQNAQQTISGALQEKQIQALLNGNNLTGMSGASPGMAMLPGCSQQQQQEEHTSLSAARSMMAEGNCIQQNLIPNSALLDTTNTMPRHNMSVGAEPQQISNKSSTEEMLGAARRALYRNSTLSAQEQQQQQQQQDCTTAMAASVQQDASMLPLSSATPTPPKLDFSTIACMSDTDKHRLLMAQQKQLELERHAATHRGRSGGEAAGTHFALKHAQERVAALRRQALQRHRQQLMAMSSGDAHQGRQGRAHHQQKASKQDGLDEGLAAGGGGHNVPGSPSNPNGTATLAQTITRAYAA